MTMNQTIATHLNVDEFQIQNWVKEQARKNTQFGQNFLSVSISFWITLKCFTKLYTIKPFDLTSYCPIPSFTATLASLLCLSVSGMWTHPTPHLYRVFALTVPSRLNSFLQKSRAITFSPLPVFTQILASQWGLLPHLPIWGYIVTLTSLVIQWLSFCACNTGALGLIPPGQGTDLTCQLKTLHAAMKIKDPARPTKTLSSQINKVR